MDVFSPHHVLLILRGLLCMAAGVEVLKAGIYIRYGVKDQAGRSSSDYYGFFSAGSMEVFRFL